MSASFSIQRIFADHWPAFLVSFLNIRPVVLAEVRKMLSCGDPRNGYILYRCPSCFKKLIVPFRCKSRFCPTCGNAYQQDRSLSIFSKLLNCSHRHIVFTIPAELRPLFRLERQLLSVLFTASSSTLLSWFAGLNQSEHFVPGIVASLHTFGRDLKWNPHIHILVTEGASGRSIPWKQIHHIPFVMLRKRWQATLLSLLDNSIDDPQLAATFSALKSVLFKRYPDGFYVNAPYKSRSSTKHTVKYIVRYLGRPPMAQSRILNYDGSSVTFFYHRHEDGAYVEECIPAFDFIKRLIIHIPDRSFHMLRYYGLYTASRHTNLARRFFHCYHDNLVKYFPTFRRWVYRFAFSFNINPNLCSCGQFMEVVAVVPAKLVKYFPP